MTLIIENGTGIESANAYATVDEFKIYYRARNVDIDSTNSQIITSLIEAAQYLDLRWGRGFGGRPLVASQGLEFPRSGARDRYANSIHGVPEGIKDASIIYAREWINNTLYPTPPSCNPKEIRRQRTSIGAISTETEYTDSVKAGGFLAFPLADRLCQQYIKRSAGVLRN